MTEFCNNNILFIHHLHHLQVQSKIHTWCEGDWVAPSFKLRCSCYNQDLWRISSRFIVLVSFFLLWGHVGEPRVAAEGQTGFFLARLLESESKVGSVEFPVGLKMWRWWSPVFCQCQAPVETRWTNAVDPVAAFVTLDLSLHEIFTAGCNWSSTQLCLFVAISSRTMFQAEWKHLKFIHPKQKAEIRD